MRKIFIAMSLSMSCYAAAEPTAFTGIDFSGTYDCVGNDHHDGQFKGTIALALIRVQSSGEYGSYSIKFNAEGFGGYTGYAAAHGSNMALYFSNDDASTKDYGNSIVNFDKNKNGKWQFESFYYEPEYYGGNIGSERCVMR